MTHPHVPTGTTSTSTSAAATTPIVDETATRPDPFNTAACTHPDCGKFFDANAGRMVCSAMRENACAAPK